MNSTIRSRSLIVILTAAGAVHWAAAQGPLTPPGAPAPTMKTLDQIEPRKPIDATNTPGDATNVFRITAPGSYYLAAPLTGVAAKHGISIEASDVTIDLRGFTVAGIAGSLDGLHVAAGSSRLTVRNGTISGWGADGVDEVEDGAATNGIYENIQSTGNSGDGLRLGERCTVKACRLSDNGVYGLSAGGPATISGSTAINNGASGFYFGNGSVLDSVASSNGGSGFESWDEPVLMKNCVASENSDTGLRTGTGGKFSDCIAQQNGTGIDAGYFSTVTHCTVKNNGVGINAGGSCHIVGNMCEGNGNGIHTYEGKNVIDGNQAINGGTGILVNADFVESTNNLIIRNTAGGNATNYDIAVKNRFGPIVNITDAETAATPAAVGNSAASTLTLDGEHPWANFAYGPPPPPSESVR